VDGHLLGPVRHHAVHVTNRANQTFTLTAGTQASYDDTVPRCTSILPVDRGTVDMAATNTFVWTSFTGFVGYLFEYTLSASGFAQANAAVPEAGNGTLVVAPGAFTVVSGTVEFSIPVPAGLAPAGTRAQWRGSPANGSGQVLSGAQASDASTAVLQ
jgi:hypothetical protein